MNIQQANTSTVKLRNLLGYAIADADQTPHIKAMTKRTLVVNHDKLQFLGLVGAKRVVQALHMLRNDGPNLQGDSKVDKTVHATVIVVPDMECRT